MALSNLRSIDDSSVDIQIYADSKGCAGQVHKEESSAEEAWLRRVLADPFSTGFGLG